MCSDRFMGVALAILAFVLVYPGRVSGQTSPATVTITCDDAYSFYVNGVFVGNQIMDGQHGWDVPDTWPVELAFGENVIAVLGWDKFGGWRGLIAEVTSGGSVLAITNGSWLAHGDSPGPAADWIMPSFDDGSWAASADLGPYDAYPWGFFAPPMSAFSQDSARWIWHASGSNHTFFRKRIFVGGATASRTTTLGQLKVRYR